MKMAILIFLALLLVATVAAVMWEQEDMYEGENDR